MAKVSTDGMRGTAVEIKSLIDILKNRATSTAMGAERMSQAASILTGYNGQIVQGTVVNTNQFDGKHVSHYKEYQTWIINTNGVEELASSFVLNIKGREDYKTEICGSAIQLKYDLKNEVENIKKQQSPFLWVISFLKNKSYNVSKCISYNEESLNQIVNNLSYKNTDIKKWLNPTNPTLQLLETV